MKPEVAQLTKTSFSSEQPPAKKQSNNYSFHPDQSSHLILSKSELFLDPEEGLLISEEHGADGPNDPIQ